MKKKILILAKSNKARHDHSYGKCIAGITRGSNGKYEWIRLVADKSGDSVLEEDFPFCPLDIIEAEVYPCPHNNHVENHIFDSVRKISSITISQLKNIYREMPHSFFGSMSNTFQGRPENSLTILLASNIHFYWKTGDDGRKHQKVDFKIGNNMAKDVAMTDPDHYTNKRTSEEKVIPLAICVASLPDSPVYSKFIASIFPIDNYER